MLGQLNSTKLRSPSDIHSLFCSSAPIVTSSEVTRLFLLTKPYISSMKPIQNSHFSGMFLKTPTVYTEALAFPTSHWLGVLSGVTSFWFVIIKIRKLLWESSFYSSCR